MKSKLLLMLLLLQMNVFAQLIIQQHIRIPGDSSWSAKIKRDLNAFIGAATYDFTVNRYIYAPQAAETAVLTDELDGLSTWVRNNDTLRFRPQLINIHKPDSGPATVQLAWISIQRDTPVIRAQIVCLALLVNDTFRFFSPLTQYSATWYLRKVNHVTFHMQERQPDSKTNNFLSYLNTYDKKLGIVTVPMDYYIGKDVHSALQAMGLEYLADYNGWRYQVLSATAADHYVMVDGSNATNSFDPHDLWHARLRKKVSRDSVNRWVDEGCAYVYGGSWAIPWNTILRDFKKQFVRDTTNYLQLYKENRVFGEKSTPLNTAYVMNALIVQALEKEKGFQSVLRLVSCGLHQKDEVRYFNRLKELTGIDEAHFNERIKQLLKE